MFTKKKIALFLITAGIVSFLIGVYQFKQSFPGREATIITLKSRSRATTATTPNPIEKRIPLSNEWLLTVSLLMTGLGSYLAGSTKAKNAYHRLTLDFSNKAKTLAVLVWLVVSMISNSSAISF